MSSSKPHYWNGTGWVQEEAAALPDGLTVADFPSFVAANGVPQDAKFCVVAGYLGDGPETALRWFTPVAEDAGSDSDRKSNST